MWFQTIQKWNILDRKRFVQFIKRVLKIRRGPNTFNTSEKATYSKYSLRFKKNVCAQCVVFCMFIALLFHCAFIYIRGGASLPGHA